MKLHFIIAFIVLICTVFAKEFDNPLNLPSNFAEEYIIGKESHFGGSKSCTNYESKTLYYSEMFSLGGSESKKYKLNGYNVLFSCDINYYPTFTTKSSYRFRILRIKMGYEFRTNAALVYGCNKDNASITVTCKHV